MVARVPAHVREHQKRLDVEGVQAVQLHDRVGVERLDKIEELELDVAVRVRVDIAKLRGAYLICISKA